jgi:lathosterol oxidase
MSALPVPTARRSWLAHISAALGLSALLGVLCFHFPELLTSRDFRAVYTEVFARHLLLFGLIAAFTTGTFAILRGRNRRVAMLGVGSAAVAVCWAAPPCISTRSTPRRSRWDWTGS